MNKEIIFKTSAAFILFVLLSLGLYALITSKNNNIDYNEVNIPEIKVNYTNTTLSKYIEFDNKIKYLNNKFIITNNNEEYYLTYNNTLQYQKVNETKINKNYTIQTNEETNQKYIINNTNNTISDMYETIEEVTFDNETYSYLILSNNNKYFILNLLNDELIELTDEITYINDLYNYNNGKKELISNKYIKVENNNKYGIIDYNGNIIIDIKYDNIIIAEDTFIVKNNSKYGLLNTNQEELIELNYQQIIYHNNNYVIKKDNKYGIVDKEKNILFNFEIDYVEKLENYLIVIKDNKLGIIKDNKLVIDYQIYTKNNQINTYIQNNELYINTYIDNSIKTYVIKDNKIKKLINNELRQIEITDYEIDTSSDIVNNYTYSTNIENNILNLYVYDNEYNKHYEHNIELKVNLNEYDIYPTLTKNYSNDYYKLTIIKDNNDNIENIYYYYDLNKKVVMSEKEALNKYLENGYSFTLNNNNELKIYKKDKVISIHNNIKYYIGGYFFSDTNGIIYKLEFKNESNN